MNVTYIAKILWIRIRGLICFCNKAVANDDLLSLFTTSRKVANGSQNPFGVFKITIGTIGKTPNVPIVVSANIVVLIELPLASQVSG